MILSNDLQKIFHCVDAEFQHQLLLLCLDETNFPFDFDLIESITVPFALCFRPVSFILFDSPRYDD